MSFFIYFLSEIGGDYFKALANLIKESSPLISGIFKFFLVIWNFLFFLLFLTYLSKFEKTKK